MASREELGRRLRASLAVRLGLAFDAAKDTFLGEIAERVAGSASKGEAFVDGIEEGTVASDDWIALVRQVTVSETYFFRHREQFQALREAALPARVAAQQRFRALRLLSAGCASGEEAYSLAIAVREFGVPDSWPVSVRAVDANPALLERAGRGVYSAWSLRDTDETVRERWFLRRVDGFEVHPSVRSMVRFDVGNLVDPIGEGGDRSLWAPGAYDVVFCRNVLMYFTTDAARSLVARIASAMGEGAYLFVGHAESLRELSDDFELCDSHGTFYYRRKRGAAAIRATSVRPAPSTLPPPADGSMPWFDTVQRVAERIRSLVTTLPEEAPKPPAPALPSLSLSLVPILASLESERFAEALERLESLPPDRAVDPDARLVHAVLLVHLGRLTEAEALATPLLAFDAVRASAHYTIALCRDGAGDLRAAAEHDRVAAHADPTFAMPRLHLALLARRTRQDDVARRELEKARELLVREEPSRLLLFAGGFGREGLLALCRSELLALHASERSS